MTGPVLVVVAHPDDECWLGGTLARFASEGHGVHVLALADGETSRPGATEGDIQRRSQQQQAAARILGCESSILFTRLFADQRLDMAPLLDMTRLIETRIREVGPSAVYTHSPGDLNADHRRVYEAVLPAVRPKSGVQAVYSFAGPRMLRFEPTSFWNITGYTEKQLAAMACYGDELSDERELVQARAVEYGYRVGVTHAEGFEVVRECR